MNIRCYDNGGESYDRYTICYTRKVDGRYVYVGASAEPFHPQGFGQHGDSPAPIDRPAYRHLGKRVTFDSLPPDVQKLVRQDHAALYGGGA